MRQNMSSFDRSFRVVLGAAILSLVFIGPQTPWGWLGIIPVLTGLSGYCPLYHAFGWSTCKPVQRR